ncbi:MAG: hypothetical protein EOO03_08135, partial [Chitinophagaceae bacterium]
MSSQSMTQNKNTTIWPYAIIAAFVLFIGYIGYMVKGAINSTVDLVSKDYYQKEIAAANYPQIREFVVPKQVALLPQDDVSGDGWKVCNPQNAAAFSAVAYFFARELNKELQVPVGLINTTWGGTMVETWTSREAYENSEEFKTMIAAMPKVSLEELQKKRTEESKKKLVELQGGTPSA